MTEPPDVMAELAHIYNRDGRKAMYECARNTYGVKDPWILLRQMREAPKLAYDAATDSFEIASSSSEDVFMSMEELCSAALPISEHEHSTTGHRAYAFELLINGLIQDRLLELNRYVHLDVYSRRLIINRTALATDGYSIVDN